MKSTYKSWNKLKWAKIKKKATPESTYKCIYITSISEICYLNLLLFFLRWNSLFHYLRGSIESPATKTNTESGTLSNHRRLDSHRLAPITTRACATILQPHGQYINWTELKFIRTKAYIGVTFIFLNLFIRVVTISSIESLACTMNYTAGGQP